MSYSCSSVLVLRIIIVIGLLGGYHYCSCEEVEFTSGFMDLEYLSRKLSTHEEANSRRVAVHPLTEQLRVVESNQFACDGEIIGFYIAALVRPFPMEEDNVIPHYPRAIIWSRQPRASDDDDDDDNCGDDDDKRDVGDNNCFGYHIKEHVELKPSFSNIHSESGIYQYFLPSNPLRFQEGDVFGVHQPPPSESAVVLHYITLTETFDTLSLVTTATDVTYIDNNDLQLVDNQYLLIYPVVLDESTSCLQGFLDIKMISNLTSNIGRLFVPSANELRLFPDITFTRSGYITSWTIGGVSTSDSTHTLPETEQQKSELQIWRPTANTSYYTRIEQYKLGKADNNLTSHMFKYTVTPPIPVMAGDILSVFQPSNSAIKIYYQENNGPDNIVIPTEEESNIVSQTIDISTVQIGLSNDYPLVAVNVTDYTLLDITPTVYSISGTSNESTPSVTISQQPLPRSTLESSEQDLVLPLTLSGTIAVLIIVIVIIVIIALYMYVHIRRYKHKQKELPPPTPGLPSTVMDTSSNTSYSTVNGNNRESMHYNPVYYLKHMGQQGPSPPDLPPRDHPVWHTVPEPYIIPKQQNKEPVYAYI